MIEALNFLHAIAPLYVVPGNHEFDSRDQQVLVDAVRGSKFVWVGDNVQFRTGIDNIDQRMTPLRVFHHGEYSIGFFGLTLAGGRGGHFRDFAPVDGDYMAAAEAAMQAFQRQGVDLIVGLTHLNLPEDLELSELRARYPRFLWIAGGHEHELEFQALSQSRAMITKGASNARVIWRIDITFGPGLPQLNAVSIPLDEKTLPAEDYLQFEDRWRRALLDVFPFLNSTLGHAAVPLDGRESTVRRKESNWGNFIADQMRNAFGEPSNFAIINGGTIRIDDIIEGNITFEDIARTFAYSNALRKVTMSGADFQQVLERSFKGQRSGMGYFLQVSGFRVCFDRSLPEGERVIQLLAPNKDGWQTVDLDKDYTVVVPDYLFRGGDNYDFSRARLATPPAWEAQYLVLDAIIQAQARGVRVGQPVNVDLPRIAQPKPGEHLCFNL